MVKEMGAQSPSWWMMGGGQTQRNRRIRSIMKGQGKLKSIARVGMALVLAVSMGLMFALPAAAAVITVPGDHATIGAAITAATAGDTITVAAGTYAENVVVSKALTLQGAAGATIAPATGHGVEITASNVTVDGFTITPLDSADDIALGIAISVAGSGVTISNNTITTLGKNHGIWVGVSFTGLAVTDNVITVGGVATSIYADGGPSQTVKSSGWTISGNTLDASLGVNLELYDVDAVTVDDNTFEIATTMSNIIVSSELFDLTGPIVFTNNNVKGNGGGSMVAFVTDFQVYLGTRVDAFVTTMDDVTIAGNTIAGWASRGLRFGDWGGAVTNVVVNSNTFNMTTVGEVIGGTDAPGATGSGNTFNVAFPATIQGAVDSAFSGDTINVTAGTYNESVLIGKPLTLQGPNAGISPNTGSWGAEAVITGVSPLVEVETGADVNPLTIEGLTFQGATVGTGHAGVIRADGLVAGASEGWGNVTIRSNRFIDNYGPAIGVWATSGLADWIITDNLVDGVTGPTKSGIYLDLDYLDLGAGSSFTGWEVTDNTVKDTQYGGIMVHHSVDMLIAGNTIEGVQKTGIQSSGIQGNVTITDNVITRAMLDQTSPLRAGIRLYGTDLADQYGESQLIGPVWVTNNIVTDSYIGFATKSGHDYTAQEVHVNGNSFIGNNLGLRHPGTGLLDAENNWWGDIAGPSISTNPYNSETGGQIVSGNVDYMPWLIRVDLATGWNIVSDPIASESVAEAGPAPIVAVYWFDSSTQLWGTDPGLAGPLDAVYYKVSAPISFIYAPSSELTMPSQKAMKVGWNFVGLAQLYSMNADVALTDVYEVTGGLVGYSKVISPSLNGASWTYLRDGGVGPNMLPLKGYWVFMVNDGVLGGWTDTPIVEVTP